ncbi:MAG: hypothetical protein ACK2VA_11755 [Anaerolineae bacterium]
MTTKREKPLAAWIAPFRSGNGWDVKLILAFLLVNGLVLVNAYLHDPHIGYDTRQHLRYVQALSEGRLATPQDSDEFFSPPLPYALPALLMAATGMDLTSAAQAAQYVNVLLSIGLTLYLIAACHLLSASSALKLGALAALGILPVYYKTFAFVRGEPYVVFFSAAVLYYALLVSVRKQFTLANAALLGLAMGGCALSRQWGILLLPAVFLFFALQWIRLPRWRPAIARTFGLCLVLVAATSSWFYVSLYARFDSMAAFNRDPAARFSLANQPLEFYVGLDLPALFTKPVRPSFPNQLPSILYADVWGDYWGYFSVYGRDTRSGTFLDGPALYRVLSQDGHPDWLETNYEAQGAYLGRVNLVALFPTAIALLSLVAGAAAMLRARAPGAPDAPPRSAYAFLLLAIGTVVTGYLWFLIMYPSPGKGDTIKASFVLHAFPYVALLVGLLLARVRNRSRALYGLILGGLGLTFIHNVPAMLTHYVSHPLL